MRLVRAVTLLGSSLCHGLASLFGTFSIQDLFHSRLYALQPALKLKTRTFLFISAYRDDAETPQDPLSSTALCCCFSHRAFAYFSTRSFEVILVKMIRADEDSFYNVCLISQTCCASFEGLLMSLFQESTVQGCLSSAQLRSCVALLHAHTDTPPSQASFSRSHNGKGMTSRWISA